jgi:molybdopterin-guanine dinucleotide biosynthesis protein A
MAAGVLVCGGASTRFGDADKVCFPLAGKPLVRHVADRLAPIIDELVVNCREDQRGAIQDALRDYDHPVTYAFDEQPDAGPLHGIDRGLSAVDSTYAVVVACDMPFVDPAFVEHLFAVAEDREGAIPRYGDEGWYQPLQAVYHVEAMRAAVAAAEAEGIDRPIEAARKVDFETVEGEALWERADEWTFFNVNTREDLAEAESHLASR